MLYLSEIFLNVEPHNMLMEDDEISLTRIGIYFMVIVFAMIASVLAAIELGGIDIFGQIFHIK
jgi:hypothetical protein